MRIKDVDSTSPSPFGEVDGPYNVGDHVWVKPPNNRCTKRFNGGRVTGILSQQSVEVDGVPRHVRDLRPRQSSDTEPFDTECS